MVVVASLLTVGETFVGFCPHSVEDNKEAVGGFGGAPSSFQFEEDSPRCYSLQLGC